MKIEDPTISGYLAGLDASFKSEWKEELETVIAKARGVPMMSIITGDEACLADNFLQNADKALSNSFGTIVLVGLDNDANAFCSSQRNIVKNIALNCLDVSGWIADVVPSGKIDGAIFHSSTFLKVVWAKPLLLRYAIKKAQQGVLMLDIDIILHGDLPNEIRALGAGPETLMFGCDNNWCPLGSPDANTGSIWAGRDSTDRLDNWIAAESAVNIHGSSNQGDDQTIFNHLIESKHAGTLGFIPSRILGECAQGGRSATHYNCVNKMKVMSERHVWRPRSAECNPGGALFVKLGAFLKLQEMFLMGRMREVSHHDSKGTVIDKETQVLMRRMA